MFRLAHLSDPHLGPLPEPRLRELAGKRVLGYLNWRLNRGRGALRPTEVDALIRDIRAHAPDHTCVTGDIVNLALDGELAPALEWLASIGRPAAVSVVPGNHDAYVRGALHRATEAWGPYLKPDEGEAGRFPYVRRRGRVAVIGLSSAVATAPFMATGTFDAGQALRLAATLDHLGREGLFRVVLIHHPPTRGAIHWGARLIGADRLRAVLRRAGAELVLHGHTHRSSLEWLESPGGHIPVVGVPSASRSPGEGRAGAGWNLFEIFGEPGAWSLTRIERGFFTSDRPPVEIARRALLLEGRPQII
jgi:3',5'-cyclic AMP phosphodiesterase CpdA